MLEEDEDDTEEVDEEVDEMLERVRIGAGDGGELSLT